MIELAQELAHELTRVLRPGGALLGFFGTAQPRDSRYTKFIVLDGRPAGYEDTVL